MANMTDALELKILDGITGVSSLLSSTMALAIFTASPTDTGSVANEMTGNGYERKLLSGLFSAAAGTDGESLNTAIVNFATATGDWPTATHIGFMETDVEFADDMVVWVALNSPILITDTQVFSFAIGNLSVTAS